MADAGKIVITPKGAYSSTKTYEWLDEVSYNGNAYVALKTVTGVTPSDDGVNWRLFLEPNDIVAGNLVPKFTEASTRSNIVSGENLSTMFGKIKKWFTDLKSHAFKDLVNNLTTSTTGSALDASQGKVLQDEVDGVNRNLSVIENNTYTNIIDVFLTSGNKNGISYTVNADKSVTFNGTASGNTWITYGKFNYYKDEKYYFSGCDEVFEKGKLYTRSNLNYADTIMSFDADGYDEIIIYIPSGVTISNHTLYPMITLGEKKIQWTPPVGSEKLNDIVTKIKNDLSTHTHNYVGSDTPGGSATYALQANKDGAGNVIDATYINKTYMRNYGAGSIAFGNNMFIGIFNGDIICSSDGQEWEVNFEPNLFSLLDNDEILLGITYGNEKFVSFSNKGCSYVSSDNGNTWTKTQTIITV